MIIKKSLIIVIFIILIFVNFAVADMKACEQKFQEYFRVEPAIMRPTIASGVNNNTGSYYYSYLYTGQKTHDNVELGFAAICNSTQEYVEGSLTPITDLVPIKLAIGNSSDALKRATEAVSSVTSCGFIMLSKEASSNCMYRERKSIIDTSWWCDEESYYVILWRCLESSNIKVDINAITGEIAHKYLSMEEICAGNVESEMLTADNFLKARVGEQYFNYFRHNNTGSDCVLARAGGSEFELLPNFTVRRRFENLAETIDRTFYYTYQKEGVALFGFDYDNAILQEWNKPVLSIVVSKGATGDPYVSRAIGLMDPQEIKITKEQAEEIIKKNYSDSKMLELVLYNSIEENAIWRMCWLAETTDKYLRLDSESGQILGVEPKVPGTLAKVIKEEENNANNNAKSNFELKKLLVPGIIIILIILILIILIVRKSRKNFGSSSKDSNSENPPVYPQ